jgi:hypothetical protein
MSDQEIPSGGKRKKGEPFNMEAWWADRSLPQKIVFGIGFGILGIGLVAAFGWVVQLLWNWLVPEIFGLKRLSYLQAGGLLVLCWILFKGIRIGSDNGSRSADRKRRQQLRGYMTEAQASSEDAAAGK